EEDLNRHVGERVYEGQRGQPYRVLRTVKNRFGSTDEIGVFQMNERGMVGVTNPSRALLSERPLDVSGSVVAAAFEGTRPLLVEIQALVTQAAGGTPRRTVQGVDGNRVALMSAILDKKAGLPLVSCDLFVNLTGGIRICEPALDLAIVAAMLSSFRDRPLDPDLVLFGEVGLAGEVRSVSHVAARLREAEELGFQRCIVPQSTLGGALSTRLQVIGVSHISAVFPHLFAVDRKSV
ncbi:MAG: DNA repair protein RadA, partial [Myxococcales bacterium]|nr:DNA repair protein RadA [Myxococcales bacterium]